MKLMIAGKTHSGSVRRVNEDAFAILRLDSDAVLPNDRELEIAARGSGVLLTVVDGLESYETPVAGEIVIQSLREGLRRLSGTDLTVAALANAVETANTSLWKVAQRPEHYAITAQFVSAWVTESRLAIASLGEARAYLLRGGHLHQITRDHGASFIESHPTARSAPLALGIASDVRFDLVSLGLRPGDVLVLCSDGLRACGIESDELTREVLEGDSVERICTRLIELALSSGGFDNITVVVVRVLDGVDSDGTLSADLDDRSVHLQVG